MPRAYVISDLNGKEMFGTSYKKELQKKKKANQKEFRVEGNKLYIKWKSSDNSFNSWIDKKRYVINE